MSELRLKSTGTIKLFENDNTSSVTIASPASLGADRTVTLPDADVTLASGTMSTFDPDGAVTINDSGADVDFRVESDGNTHMLFVDGGNNRVGICGSVILPTSILEVSQDVSAGSGINSLLTISATDGGVNMSGGEGPGILFRIPDDETNPSVGAQIGALKESADDSVSNTALAFSVSQNDETLDEAMRIASDGNVSINSTVSPQKLYVYGSHVSESGLVKVHTSNGTGDVDLLLFYDGNGTECGTISLNAAGNSVAYNTSSDYRLKENTENLTDGITRLKQLKPYRFNFIDEPDKTLDGFFAHEAQTVVPEAVHGEKDAMKTEKDVIVNADGTVERYDTSEADWEKGKLDGTFASDSTWEATKEVIKTQKIDQAKLVPLLTGALQEAITKIETLEAKVTALENA